MGSWERALEYFTGHLGLTMPPCMGVAEWFLALMTTDETAAAAADDIEGFDQQGVVVQGLVEAGMEVLARKSGLGSDSGSSRLGTVAAVEVEVCSDGSSGGDGHCCSQQLDQIQEQQQQQLGTAHGLCDAWALASGAFENYSNSSSSSCGRGPQVSPAVSSSSTSYLCHSKGCGWCNQHATSYSPTTTITSSSNSNSKKDVANAAHVSTRTNHSLLSISGEETSPLVSSGSSAKQPGMLQPASAAAAAGGVYPWLPPVVLVRDATTADEEEEGNSSMSSPIAAAMKATASSTSSSSSSSSSPRTSSSSTSVDARATIGGVAVAGVEDLKVLANEGIPDTPLPHKTAATAATAARYEVHDVLEHTGNAGVTATTTSSSSSRSSMRIWLSSTAREVTVLSMRSLRWWYRNPSMLISEFIQYAFACVFLGSIYLRLSLDLRTGAPDRLSALFTFLVTLLVTAPSRALLAWNMERRLLRWGRGADFHIRLLSMINYLN